MKEHGFNSFFHLKAIETLMIEIIHLYLSASKMFGFQKADKRQISLKCRSFLYLHGI